MTEQKEYAGFFRRGAALVIDFLWFIIPSTLLNIVAFEVVKNFAANGSEWTLANYFKSEIPYHFMIIIALLSQVVWCSVVAWFLSKYKWHATPGKRLMKIYVVDENGGLLSYQKAFFRTALPVVVVIVLNLMNYNVINKNIAVADQAYDEVFKEFLPSVAQKATDSGKSFKEFLDSTEGRDFYSQEVNQLTQVRRADFAQKLQGVQSEIIAKGTAMSVLPVLFLAVLFVWYLPAAFTKQKTAMHDIILKTRVVRGKI